MTEKDQGSSAGDEALQSEPTEVLDAEQETDTRTAETADPGVDEPQPAEVEPTSEADEQAAAETKEPEPDETPAPAKRRGGWGVFLVFLIAAGALGLAGWLYYRIEYQGTVVQVEARVANVEAEQGELAGATEQLRQEQENLGTQIQAFKTDVDEVSASAVEALNDALRQTPPTEKRWKIAEIEYLLRIANHRLVLEQDAVGALDLLQVADGILTELDDFSLHDVRARLAEEILALKTVRRFDLQGLFLRLEAVKSQLSSVPLHLPEYLVEKTETVPDADESFWVRAERVIGRYFRIRTFEGRSKPLLSPEEATYLELNLRLMLERAELAALRGHQLVYEESLATAEDWMTEYLESDQQMVEALMEELRSLQTVQLRQDLPDISGSLNRLVELKAQGAT